MRAARSRTPCDHAAGWSSRRKAARCSSTSSRRSVRASGGAAAVPAGPHVSAGRRRARPHGQRARHRLRERRPGAPMVKRGDFRADLVFRLNVLTVDLPPLRARPGDAMLLAERFVRALQRAVSASPVKPLDAAARQYIEPLRLARQRARTREPGPPVASAQRWPRLRRRSPIVDDAGAAPADAAIVRAVQRGQGARHRAFRARLRDRAAAPHQRQHQHGGAALRQGTQPVRASSSRSTVSNASPSSPPPDEA